MKINFHQWFISRHWPIYVIIIYKNKICIYCLLRILQSNPSKIMNLKKSANGPYTWSSALSHPTVQNAWSGPIQNYVKKKILLNVILLQWINNIITDATLLVASCKMKISNGNHMINTVVTRLTSQLLHYRDISVMRTTLWSTTSCFCKIITELDMQQKRRNVEISSTSLALQNSSSPKNFLLTDSPLAVEIVRNLCKFSKGQYKILSI